MKTWRCDKKKRRLIKKKQQQQWVMMTRRGTVRSSEAIIGKGERFRESGAVRNRGQPDELTV